SLLPVVGVINRLFDEYELTCVSKILVTPKAAKIMVARCNVVIRVALVMNK
ncbi:MAG: hypothetical protein ACI9RV_001398, partial [Glaciecola sp.]